MRSARRGTSRASPRRHRVRKLRNSQGLLRLTRVSGGGQDSRRSQHLRFRHDRGPRGLTAIGAADTRNRPRGRQSPASWISCCRERGRPCWHDTRWDRSAESIPGYAETEKALRPIALSIELLTYLDQSKRKRFLRDWKDALCGN